MRSTPLMVGEPVPWFVCRSAVNPKFHFDSVAGRYVLLCFFETAADRGSQCVLRDVLQHRDRFDDDHVCFFGVSTDPDDERLARVEDVIPGIRFFWDFDRSTSEQCGVAVANGDGARPAHRHLTYVLDERLRVLAVVPFGDEPGTHVERLMRIVERLPKLGLPGPAATQAPVLVVPRIFEVQLCRRLIEIYEQHGGSDSGFMRQIGGKTVGMIDHKHKRRRDYEIEDEAVRRACMVRIHDRLSPEIHKAYQFRATRMERYIVACYDATEGGHFRAHRDNTTRGTAHRRFAVSLHLNTGNYEGGLLRFPEFGRQLYSAPVGGAVVFSCSLLHEATPVTGGKRYMFLPFLYDEEAARIRQENQQFVELTN